MNAESHRSPLERLVRGRGRRIVVAGTTWYWRVGRSNVVARNDAGEKRCERIWTIKGLTPHDFERGQWKRTSDGQLTPGEVAAWLAKPPNACYTAEMSHNVTDNTDEPNHNQ